MKSKNNPNQRFFVKTFSQSLEQEEKTRCIDCREHLIYKLLEFTGFGPKTSFLTHRYSSGRGSSGGSYVSGNYIITEDVTSIRQEEKEVKERIFYLDGDENSLEIFKEAM